MHLLVVSTTPLLLPFHDSHNRYFPSQVRNSDEDLTNYEIPCGNRGKKKAKGPTGSDG